MANINTDFTDAHHQYPHVRGVYSDILYLHRLGQYLGVKLWNFDIFGGFQKNEYFWVYFFVSIFLGATAKLDYYVGHVKVLLK